LSDKIIDELKWIFVFHDFLNLSFEKGKLVIKELEIKKLSKTKKQNQK